jgi:hypothetical protein
VDDGSPGVAVDVVEWLRRLTPDEHGLAEVLQRHEG